MTLDPVDAMLAAHAVPGPWTPIATTGLANRVYATPDAVLRVATDHPEAIPDARTESVAAPAARQAGVRTPRLIAFDDSRSIVDRPFSIWERVHGDTLGLARLDVRATERVWREVGEQLALLHDRVRVCPDPQGYLDTPGFELDRAPTVARLVDTGAASRALAREIEMLLGELAPLVAAARPARCFVHDDLHDMNLMCAPAGELLALIDWGDAGWGDPALDFLWVPLERLASAFDAYGAASRSRLGSFPEARIVWGRLHDAMDHAIAEPGRQIPLETLRRYLDSRSG